MRCRALAILSSVVLAACAQPSSDACDDGTYCPRGTTCGAQNVCFAHADRCGDFHDGMPCLIDVESSGFCEAGTCDRGADVIAVATAVPAAVGLPGVEGIVRDHPEVLKSIGNANGYFGFRTPRGITVLIEVSYPDMLVSITRPATVGDDGLLLDYLYGGIPMISAAVAELFARQANVSLLPERGFITGTAFDRATNKEGGAVSVSVPPGTCDGPYYFGADGAVALGATTTLASGAFAFANCRPGATVLTATGAAGPCRPLDAASPGDIAIVPEPERVLYVGRIVCEP